MLELIMNTDIGDDRKILLSTNVVKAIYCFFVEDIGDDRKTLLSTKVVQDIGDDRKTLLSIKAVEEVDFCL